MDGGDHYLYIDTKYNITYHKNLRGVEQPVSMTYIYYQKMRSIFFDKQKIKWNILSIMDENTSNEGFHAEIIVILVVVGLE